MYDTYSRYIYEWLTNTFFINWESKIDSILDKLDSILTLLEWGLQLGIFVFLFWVVFTFWLLWIILLQTFM